MIVIVILIIIILLWFRSVSNRHRKLKAFVSPPGRLMFKHLHLFDSKNMLERLLETVKEYGGLLRLELIYGKDILFVTDKDFISFLLGSTIVLNKTDIYRHTQKWLGTGLLTSDREKWEKHRKAISPAFRIQILENYVEVFHKAADTLIESLKEVDSHESVNIFPFIKLCTLDIICETAMGTKIHAQKNKCPDYIHSIKEECRILMDRNRSVYKNFDLLYIFTKDFWKERKILNTLHNFTRNILRKKKQEQMRRNIDKQPYSKKNLSFLDLLLEYNRNKQLMSDEEMAEEVDTFMFAGHDTTASGIAFALYCLSTHPDTQEKVRAEQKLIFGHDNRLPTFKDLQGMKYLEMVIKESLRLYPPVPLIGRKLENDLNYGDSVIPKNSSVVIFTYGLHRNPFYFPNPDKFIPERFNSNTASFTYIPFSAGVRNCIGQRFAMFEMKYLISRVLNQFELHSVPGFSPQLLPEIVLISGNGIKIKLMCKLE